MSKCCIPCVQQDQFSSQASICIFQQLQASSTTKFSIQINSHGKILGKFCAMSAGLYQKYRSECSFCDYVATERLVQRIEIVLAEVFDTGKCFQ